MNGILCLILVFSFQQDGEIVTELLDTSTSSDLFLEAREKYNSVRRNESEDLFKQIVTLLEQKENLSEDDHLVFTKSLEYLGILSFPEGTGEQFTKLILFDPYYEPVPKEISPKILEVFQELKAKLVSTLKVTARDARDNNDLEGARLFLDGVPVGNIDRETTFNVPVGPHKVEIRKPNYDPSVVDLEVLPGQPSTYDGLLFRNAAELLLVTSPPGVTVTLDGAPLGSSDLEVPSGYRKILRDNKIDENNAGALVANNLKPGKVLLTFEKPCFQKRTIMVPVEELEQITLAPVEMAPSAASLTVTTASKDTGGLLFLNQERIGYLPVENHRVCPGEYELKVRFTDGEFIRKVTIIEDSNLEVVAEPLPSIAWFGLDENDQDAPPLDLNAQMAHLATWNVRTINPHNTEQVPVNPFPILFGSHTMTAENNNLMTRKLRADLYLAARVVRRKGVIPYLEVAFWSPLSNKIQVQEFDFREIHRFEELMVSLDRFPPLTKPWLGVHATRLNGLVGCKVIEIEARGPLAGKVQPGEVILEMNNAILRNPGDLINLNDLNPITLTVNGQSISVTPVDTIAEVPFQPSGLSMQGMLARFEKLARYHQDPLVRLSARFNQARFQMFLGDYQAAYDIFSTMNLNLPYGINQGTLYYYQALCFQRLDLNGEARSTFRKVLEHPGATLFDANGPKASFWAQAELGSSM